MTIIAHEIVKYDWNVERWCATFIASELQFQVALLRAAPLNLPVK